MKSIITIDSLTFQLISRSDSPFNHKYITQNFLPAGNIYSVSDSVKLRYVPKLDKFYLHAWAVWVDGARVATLCTDNRQKGQRQNVRISFENEVFYTAPGWAHYLKLIQKALPLDIAGISYLEIAFDFQRNALLLPVLSNVYRHSTLIDHNPEAKYAPLQHQQKCSLLDGAEYVFGNSLKGNKGSGKQVIVYHKTPEIVASGKDYISAYYALNNFDVGNPVERIEVRLSSRYFSRFVVYENELIDPQSLGNIFRMAVGDTFCFRVLGKYRYDANRNRKNETLTLIDFPEFLDTPLYVRPTYAQDGESERRNRMEAKNAVLRFIAHGHDQDSAQLEYLRQTLTVPEGTNWAFLFSQYAKEFEGTPTPARMARIDMFR